MRLEFVVRDSAGGEEAAFLVSKEGVEYLFSILDEAESKLKHGVLSVSQPVYRSYGIELVRYVYREPLTIQLESGDRVSYNHPRVVKAKDVYDLHIDAVTMPYANRSGDCFILLYASHLLSDMKQYRTVTRCIALIDRTVLEEWYEILLQVESGLFEVEPAGALS